MNVPSVFRTTTPPAVVGIVCVAVAASPVASAIAITSLSGSVSLLITLLVSGVSARDANTSSVAIGDVLSMVAGSAGSTGELRSRTSIETLAVSVFPDVSITV